MFTFALRRSCLALVVFAGVVVGRAADELALGFETPPAQTKPWCYWYWISDHITREGITKDLEAMADVGIGEVLIGNIFLDNQPAGTVKALSEEWWRLIEHAIREGGRVGVNIGIFNCPGWSQSGGPWIGAQEAMRYLATSETRVTGPARFSSVLAAPATPFQDVALLAYPVPENDRPPPQPVASSSAVINVTRLVDGDRGTTATFPTNSQVPVTVALNYAEPLTARSLEIFPGAQPFGAEVEFWARTSAGVDHLVRRFRCDRSNMRVNVGPLPQGPVTVAFEPVTAREFRLVFHEVKTPAAETGLAEIRLSGAARLESFIEKQLGKMHPTPLPKWETYMWPAAAEPDVAAGHI